MNLNRQFHWLNIMSVGVAEFDNDHKQFIAILTELETVLGAGDGERAKALGDDLMILCRDHCAREKAFLEKINYPDAANVLAAQQNSLTQVQELVEKIPCCADNALTLAKKIQAAMIDYLLKGDINFKSYVEAFGFSDTGVKHTHTSLQNE